MFRIEYLGLLGALMAASGCAVIAWDTRPVTLPGVAAITVDITRPEQVAAMMSGDFPFLIDPNTDYEVRLSVTFGSNAGVLLEPTLRVSVDETPGDADEVVLHPQQ